MLTSCAGAPPATATLARIPGSDLNTCTNLQQLTQPDMPQISHSCAVTPFISLLDRHLTPDVSAAALKSP
jgi:hypothetical protein